MWIVLLAGGMCAAMGSNDIANVLGSPVGSRALSKSQAVFLGALAEVLGSLIFGHQVTASAFKSGLVSLDQLESTSRVTEGYAVALASVLLWVGFSTFRAIPVSTTHSIIGAVLFFIIAEYGSVNVHWFWVAKLILSWILSPIAGALVASVVFLSIMVPLSSKRFKSSSDLVGIVSLIYFGTCLVVFLFVLNGNVSRISQLVLSICCAAGVGFYVRSSTRKSLHRGPSAYTEGIELDNVDEEDLDYLISQDLASSPRTKSDGIKRVSSRLTDIDIDSSPSFIFLKKSFLFLQCCAAAVVVFGHGSNDIANAMGPLTVIYELSGEYSFFRTIVLLAYGSICSSLGLFFFGSKVMTTTGSNLTSLSSCAGFCVLFGTASSVLIASSLGIPVSTGQTLIGAIIGIGITKNVFFRIPGQNLAEAINYPLIRKIVISWLITIPVAGTLTLALYWSGLGFFLTGN